jgi:energy-coupling factor transporter ATP-binding protein EcfA2
VVSGLSAGELVVRRVFPRAASSSAWPSPGRSRTAELDTAAAMRLLDVFREARDACGVTVIVVTHDRRLSRRVDRVVAIRDGRTSSELVRRASYREALDGIGRGMGEAGHEEMVIVDRVGRLQIPREYLEELGIAGRAKVDLEDGRIVITPPKKEA